MPTSSPARSRAAASTIATAVGDSMRPRALPPESLIGPCSLVADADRGTRGERALEHGLGIITGHHEVAHLAPRAGVVLAVQVQAQAGHRVQQRPFGLAVGAVALAVLVPQLAEQVQKTALAARAAIGIKD